MALHQYSTHFGIPEILSSDGASGFTSAEMTAFCSRWGITQRISSAHYARSNKCAEVAVKSAKQLIQDNLTPNGDLDCERFARVLLMHRKSPDQSTGVSPAQIVMGCQLRDRLPSPLGSFAPHHTWKTAASSREQSYLIRHYKKAESLSKGTAPLSPLHVGDHVYVQDQTGSRPT